MQTDQIPQPGAAAAATGSTAKAADKAGKTKDDDEPSAFERDLAAIREKGFRTFAEELDDKKREELRKKILAAMGLSEEALEEMPAEQRAAIEKIVAQEIQKRLSANDTLEEGQGPKMVDTGLSQQVLSSPGGTAPGLIQALEQADKPVFAPREDR